MVAGYWMAAVVIFSFGQGHQWGEFPVLGVIGLSWARAPRGINFVPRPFPVQLPKQHFIYQKIFL